MVAQYMAQPFKHPKTGGYYYRRVVPPGLREALGRTEFRISLETKDLREAKARYLEVAARVEQKLSGAAGGPVCLLNKEVFALAGLWYRRMLEKYEADPGEPLGWEVWASDLIDAHDQGRIAAAVAPQVDRLLKDEGLVIDTRSREALDNAMLLNAIKLSYKLMDRASGDYSLDPFLATIPEWLGMAKGVREQKASPVPVFTLFEALAKERRYPPKTHYSWQRILRKLTTHVGHDDAAKITDADIIAWKDALVSSGLGPKTIENHLTIIKTFFRWAAKNKRIPANPAADVDYLAKRDPTTHRLSYSDDDARRILEAARLEREPHKRWVPWLSAFTGARCDELCGAMTEDVGVEDGVNVIRIDVANREAGGSVKNVASIRSIPLHPALLAEGFLNYVDSLPRGGPLFPDLTPDRFGRRGGNGSKTIGRWIRRRVGISDPRKAPNHSWRHRFADECRKAGISRELRFAIEGHAGGQVGDTYGSEGHPLRILAEAIRKLPNPLDPALG